MTEKEIQEIAHKIVKEVSMLPNLSEYEVMTLCATKALRFITEKHCEKELIDEFKNYMKG